MRCKLPVVDETAAPDALDQVEIAIPCQVPWDSMRGDDRVRHCGQCKQNVYNVSELTRAEALRLVSGRACLRIYRRPDNTVVTLDCRARLRAARKKGVLVFAGALLIVLWAQVCAQFVGLLSLRRLIGGHTMGAPAPIAAPAPASPPETVMGPAPLPQTMGEPAPARPEPPKGRLMGKRIAPPKKHLRRGVVVPTGEPAAGSYLMGDVLKE